MQAKKHIDNEVVGNFGVKLIYQTISQDFDVSQIPS